MHNIDDLSYAIGLLAEVNANYGPFVYPFLLPFDTVFSLISVSCHEIHNVVNLHPGCKLRMTEVELVTMILNDANLYYNVTPQEFISFIFKEMTGNFYLTNIPGQNSFSYLEFLEIRQHFDCKEHGLINHITEIQIAKTN